VRIALLQPYDTGSHAAWLRGYARYSRHEVLPLTLTGQFWKWRMHGGAVTLARRLAVLDPAPDLLLATDMLDLTTLLALSRRALSPRPVALYMHENQLTYPPRPGEKRDLHYGFINYASMLCADRVLFNSQYHLDVWFDELPRMLKHFPDHCELRTIPDLRVKSLVLPLGLDLSSLDAHRPAADPARTEPPLILWSHRWEYDKAPEVFLRALYTLAERGVAFRVAFLGESFVRIPPEFEAARERLGARIVQFGWVESRADYARWLWRADIVVSTAIHEFFGASVVEALYCGAMPILPNRLSYPQFVPNEWRSVCLYDDEDQLVERLAAAIQRCGEQGGANLRSVVAPFDWGSMAPRYDRLLQEMMTNLD